MLMYDEALKYLKQMFGNQAGFREGQWEAIQHTLQNKKALIYSKLVGVKVLFILLQQSF